MVQTTMLIGGIIAGFVLLAIGGGVGYFMFIASRPKKMTWNALVYQLSDGVIPSERKDGKLLREYKLSELKPFAEDVIMKIDKKGGATHYWLKSLQKAVPVVTADCVEVWGNKKTVKVLLEGDTTTLLKAGYDKKVASQVFKPMPHDRINMIKTEIEERNLRIENSKDVLAQISPFLTVGISVLGLVMCVYFIVQGSVKAVELGETSIYALTEEIHGFRVDLLEAQGCFIDRPELEITKEEIPPTIIPP